MAYPQRNTESQWKIMNDHDSTTVGDVTSTIMISVEGDKDNSDKAHAALNDMKNDLSSAFDVFLAAEVGITKKVSKNVYILREMSIRVVYLQSYNITLQAGALDGNNSISCYIYSFNSADINIFKSDRKSIITKLGATMENIAVFNRLIIAMQELEDMTHPRRSSLPDDAHSSVPDFVRSSVPDVVRSSLPDDVLPMLFKSARVESEKAIQLRAIAQELVEMTPETLHILK